MVRWTTSAAADLERLGDYLRQFNAVAADRTVGIIFDQVETLAIYPHRGKAGRIDGTRELVVSGTPFIVPYRVERKDIQILAVFHGAQPWPDFI